MLNNKKLKRNNRSKDYNRRNSYIKNPVTLLENNLNAPTRPETGFVSVGVHTALGALPVENAVVTFYTISESGDEEVIYHLISDRNGRVPNVELPVEYNPTDPLESPKFYFSTYNMRVQAEDYNTFNVQKLRVFPGITTDYTVNLVPLAQNSQNEMKEYNVIIPPSPVDRSNE